MKKIKSIILNTDFPSIKKKVNFSNITKNKTKTLPNKVFTGFKNKYNKHLIKKNISFYKKNPFPSNKNNLELINFYLNENKKQSKTDRLYRTEIQTSQRIIKFPSSHINQRNNNYMFDNKYITSYSSTRKKYFNVNNKLKNIDTGNILESQFFVNLNSLIGKTKSVFKMEEEKYQLSAMKLREDYDNFILKKSLLNYKSTQDTPFAHNLNTIFLLKEYKKIKLDPQKEKKNIKSNLYKIENLRKYEIEKKDSMNPNYLEYLKIIKKVRKVVFNPNEIKYKNFEFFNKYENKINFIYDISRVPYFKNRLIKYNSEINKEIKYINELDGHNFIEHKVFDFLNLKKVKMQQIKDKGINIIIDDIKNNINNKGIEDNIIANSNNKIRNYSFNQNHKENDINNDEIGINNENKFNNRKKVKLKLKRDEELEDFFINKNYFKYNPYIASEELKKVIYKKFI